jgi:hypothetical protein
MSRRGGAPDCGGCFLKRAPRTSAYGIPTAGVRECAATQCSRAMWPSSRSDATIRDVSEDSRTAATSMAPVAASLQTRTTSCKGLLCLSQRGR